MPTRPETFKRFEALFGCFQKDLEWTSPMRNGSSVKRVDAPKDTKISTVTMAVRDLPKVPKFNSKRTTNSSKLSIGDFWTLDQETNEWRHVTCVKTKDGKGHSEEHKLVSRGEHLFGVWLNRLDLAKSQLNMPDGSFITRREVQILRMYLLGFPRKVMASKLCVSVKTIEKYLTKLKEQIEALCGYESHYSLYGCLHQLNLTQFILANEDWFSDAFEQSTVQVRYG